MSDVLYRRSAVSRVGWAIPLVLFAIGYVVLLVVFGRSELTAIDFLTAAIIPGILLLVWLNTLYSICRYGNITVTRDTLRVGRHTRPVTQLDRAWLGDGSYSATLPASGEVGDLMGGSWGAAIGVGDLVSLQLVVGTRVRVQTKDREGLVAALVRAVDSHAA
jgi:hypothetical protein